MLTSLQRSPERGTGETLKEELCRRVWWSVYGIDRQVFNVSSGQILTSRRLLAICLGRPMGVEEADCNCEIPLHLDDDELEAYCRSQPERRTRPLKPSLLAGFITLSKLCRNSGKAIRAVNFTAIAEGAKKIYDNSINRKGETVRVP